MKIYLASKYSRRLELVEYKRQLEILGHTAPARWLSGNHQISDDGKPMTEAVEMAVAGDAGDDSERCAAMRQRFVEEDVKDIQAADLIICFTEPPRSAGGSRGGRHVEMGIALGCELPVWVVGHRENLFCWLPQIRFFPTWSEALNAMGGYAVERYLSTYRLDSERGCSQVATRPGQQSQD